MDPPLHSLGNKQLASLFGAYASTMCRKMERGPTKIVIFLIQSVNTFPAGPWPDEVGLDCLAWAKAACNINPLFGSPQLFPASFPPVDSVAKPRLLIALAGAGAIRLRRPGRNPQPPIGPARGQCSDRTEFEGSSLSQICGLDRFCGPVRVPGDSSRVIRTHNRRGWKKCSGRCHGRSAGREYCGGHDYAAPSVRFPWPAKPFPAHRAP